MLRNTLLVLSTGLLMPQLAAAQGWYDQEGTSSSNSAGPAVQYTAPPSQSAASSEGADGLGIALRLGYGVPFGKFADEEGADFDKFVAGQVITQFDLNYAFTPNWVLAGYLGLHVGIETDRMRDLCDEYELDCSSFFLTTGIGGEYRILPGHLVNPWVGANLGMEWSFRSADAGDYDASSSFFGLAFGGTAGLDFELKRWGVGPFLGLQVARYSSGDVSTDAGPDFGGDIKHPALHYWLQFGVRGRYQFAK